MGKYYCQIDGRDERLQIEDCSFNSVVSAVLSDNGLDIISDICYENPARGNIQGWGFSEDDLWEIDDYIDSEYSDKFVRVYNQNDEEVCRYRLNDLYKSLAVRVLECENFDTYVCELWSAQLQNFIDKGIWQTAMKAKNGTLIIDPKEWPFPKTDKNGKLRWKTGKVEYRPVLWYGVPGEKIDSGWSVVDEGIENVISIENEWGYYNGQMIIHDLGIDYMSLFDGYGDWYFECYGGEGADFHRLIDTCPIDLAEVYDKGNGRDVVSKYCESVKQRYDGLLHKTL